MNLTVNDLLSIDHVAAYRLDELAEKKFAGVSTDSRNIKKSELFVALRGETFDGHNFIRDVQKKGAVCAIVDKRFKYTKFSLPMLVVDDTVKALGQLANCYRKKFSMPVVAITGSSGKTTTKEMMSEILNTQYSVLSTRGNLNNHIGVPMTLFRLRPFHDVAVIEMGMNHAGEIRTLCEIAEPTHGMITNVGKAHLGYFGNVRNIAKAKGELFEWLGEHRSRIGFVNRDDMFVTQQAKKLKRQVRYGFTSKNVDVRGRIKGLDTAGCPQLEIITSKKSFAVQLSLQGEHNAQNALAAATVGMYFDVPTKQIKSALEKFQPIEYRMEMKRAGGVTIINDAYNANPDSVESALKSLKAMKCSGKKIVVLGDMLELGNLSVNEHKKIGRLVKKLGFQHLFTYGKFSKTMNGKHFQTKDELTKELHKLLCRGDVVLVKGSRGMKMEEVVERLETKLKRKVA